LGTFQSLLLSISYPSSMSFNLTVRGIHLRFLHFWRSYIRSRYNKNFILLRGLVLAILLEIIFQLLLKRGVSCWADYLGKISKNTLLILHANDDITSLPKVCFIYTINMFHVLDNKLGFSEFGT